MDLSKKFVLFIGCLQANDPIGTSFDRQRREAFEQFRHTPPLNYDGPRMTDRRDISSGPHRTRREAVQVKRMVPASDRSGTLAWLSGSRGPQSVSEFPVPLAVIPERYQVRESEDGTFLHCDESPRVRVRIDQKLCVSEAEARTMGERSIFLDGAGDFAPLLDNKALLYNLDHHQGCIRPFTLATCEQALVLVMNGLELDEGDWTLYANEPDLDTLLALWVMLNFRRVPKLSTHTKDILLPMLRLEGAIDANGTEVAEYCGLTQATLEQARFRLDALYEKERAFRTKERWPNLDWRQYTAVMLSEIDLLVYQSQDFQDHTSIEEILGHVEIAERKVAVACRDQSGIYEAERRLKKRWGEQLGIIALVKSSEGDQHQYTLRRVSALLNFDLRPVYYLLNLVDPAVDGRPAGKRWGGSLDIGGSPRPNGTQLQPSELLRLLQRAYRPRTSSEKLGPWFGSLFWSLGLFFWGGLASFLASVIQVSDGSTLQSLSSGARGLLAFSAVSLLAALPLTWRASRGRMWFFGWRRPAGKDWLFLAPVVLICALPASAWVPRNISLDLAAPFAALAPIALAALASEVWFRGLIHGWFLHHGAVQAVAGPWFLSRATLISSIFYATTCLAISLAWTISSATPFSQDPLALGITAAAALGGGLALGVIRERTLSIWPGVLLQFVGGLAGAALLLSGYSAL